MHVTERMQGEPLIVMITGRLTFYSRKVCRAIIKNAGSPGTHHMILNLQDVDFMDGTAPGFLALAHFNLMTRNVTMSLVGPKRHIKKMLDQANFPHLPTRPKPWLFSLGQILVPSIPRVFDNPEITKRSSSPTRDSNLISSRE